MLAEINYAATLAENHTFALRQSNYISYNCGPTTKLSTKRNVHTNRKQDMWHFKKQKELNEKKDAHRNLSIRLATKRRQTWSGVHFVHPRNGVSNICLPRVKSDLARWFYFSNPVVEVYILHLLCQRRGVRTHKGKHFLKKY